MKTFKFLTPIPQQTRGRYWGGPGLSGVSFNNGDVITRRNELLGFNFNRIQYQNPNISIGTFRWVDNYNHRILIGENCRTNSEIYVGTIGRFYDTYANRKRIDRIAFLPDFPVIQKIVCNGCIFFCDSLIFNNSEMWVRITYKKFYERV